MTKRLENTDPEERAVMMEFFKAMRERMEARNIQFRGRGPR